MTFANCLKFSEDQKSLNFYFRNGSVSITYYSKEASFKALFELDLNNKIEKSDFYRMRKEIISAQHLPVKESLQEKMYNNLLVLRDSGIITKKDYERIKIKLKNFEQ
jgi:hypothetical protein